MKHLKASKPSSLHEEVPTNNTQNLYRVEPMTFQETNPGVDLPDFNQDGDGSSGYTGNDTSGLFMPDGTIRVAEPPGDTSAILGPMASMWYAWGNFSTFGYIRQSDRKMVNLGRITGKLSDWDGVSNFTSYNTDFTIDQAVWFKDVEKFGGISNDPAEANYRAFYPGPPSNTPDQYGRYYCTTTGKPKNTRIGNNPPNRGPEGAGFPWGGNSNPNNKKKRPGSSGPGGDGSGGDGPGGEGGPGEGGPGGEGPGGPGGEGPGGPGEGGPGDGPPQDIIDPNTGEPRRDATPEELAKFGQYLQGLAQQALAGTLTPAEQKTLDQHSKDKSIFSSVIAHEYERIETLKNKAPGTHTPAEQQALRNAGLDDFVQGGMKSTDIFGDLATLAGAAAVVKSGMAVAGNAIVQGIVGFAKHAAGTAGTVKTADLISDVVTDKLPGVVGDAKNSGDYNAQLAAKLPMSILTGQPQEIKLSSAAKSEQIKNVDTSQFEAALQVGPARTPSAETTVKPTQKRPVLTKESGWGAQGGSEVNYDPKTDTLTITSEKMLRTGQEGDQFDICLLYTSPSPRD